jgi:hypothetical protein
MRHFFAAVVVPIGLTLMIVSSALAQGVPGFVIPSVPAPRDPLPRFTIAPRGMPLGAIGLPLPQIGLQPPAPIHRVPVRHRERGFYPFPMTVFYVPEPFAVAAPVEPPPKSAEPPPMPGRLMLDIAPTNAQIFADGYYVGTPADFGVERGGGIIEAGVHRLDVSAAGFEPISVDVRVVAGQVLTYRATLKALPPPVSVPASTFYLIPWCYMGNIPPSDARLPQGCDKNRAITWRP